MSACHEPGCELDAVVLVHVDAAVERGVMALVMWADWGRVEGGRLYCQEHAGQVLAGLPALRP